jgi:hypothetical protein
MNATDWRVVENGEQMESTIYEFVGEQPQVSLPRISRRLHLSRTETAQRDLSTNFQNQLIARDQRCAISGIPETLRASHIIPKRMGPQSTTAIIERYDGPLAQPVTTVYDARIGVLLIPQLDDGVDNYLFGFYKRPGDDVVSFLFYPSFSFS